MTLAADFKDRLACPRCGSPLRTAGIWTMENGEWFFTPKPISCFRPRDERPMYASPERWTAIHSVVAHTDDRTGATKEIAETKWHYLAEYECMGPLHNPDYDSFGFDYPCNNVQAMDAVPYKGPHIAQLMDAPTADKRVPDIGAAVKRIAERHAS